MSEAYKCDGCGEYYTGRSAAYFEPEYTPPMDFCPECAKEVTELIDGVAYDD